MATAAPAAWGQVLEEIIVTAQKREQTLREVPISVSAVSGSKIRDAGIVRLDDLKAYVPNLQVTETGIANNFYVRGIGSGQNQGFEQSVSIYSDGVYRGRGPQSRMPFLDLERIEVLRGPQPILFGKNAVAGAVNMVSARPTENFEAFARGYYEIEYDEWLTEATLSGPIVDTLGARFAVRYRETDGYVKNLALNRDEPQRDELSMRLTLEWNPHESFDAILRAEYGDFDIKGRQVEIFGELPAASWQRPDGTMGTPPIPGLTWSQILVGAFGQDPSALNNRLDFKRSSNGDSSDTDNREFNLTMNWRLGDVWRLGDLTLTSVTGYSRYTLAEICDCDFTGATAFTAFLAEKYDQVSQEIRIASGTDQRLSWIGGLFYQDYDLAANDVVIFPTNTFLIPLVDALFGAPPGTGLGVPLAGTTNPRVFTQDSELFAVFAQLTYSFTDTLRLTLGGRWSTEESG